jgi:tRNA A58 N-methylase Trm61
MLEFAAEAAKEFEKHKLSGWVTVRQRNIEERGFPCGAEGEEEGMIDLTGRADAVFLDLPAPYKVGLPGGVHPVAIYRSYCR